MVSPKPIRRALLSVSNKDGIVELAISLAALGIELLSTGGTAQLLKEHGLTIIDVSTYTGLPEMMDGRVKTLHPKIHGGILGRRGKDDLVMSSNGIIPIDLVVVNLYPFAQTISHKSVIFDDAIENIDIGGPALIRAAAKNHLDVTVIVDPKDYHSLNQELETQHGHISHSSRLAFAAKAFKHTAQYDELITLFLAEHLHQEATQHLHSDFPPLFTPTFIKKSDLRYGENTHQRAAFYREPNNQSACIANAIQHQGKSLSYNNIADADAAFECVKQFTQPACVIVKHANPCGVAVSDNTTHAYELAYRTDPTSAFGGIIAFNSKLTRETCSLILQQFVEVIVAPEIEDDALSILKTKPNIRVLSCGYNPWQSPSLDFKHVTGGLLVQESDVTMIEEQQLQIVTERQPSAEQLQDALFAWKVTKYVKSNAIVYAKQQATLGIGAGQMSRVYSAKIAEIKALEQHLSLNQSIMASDAFFPFRDSIDNAAQAGITCIIQPGGSIRDQEVIDAANAHHIAMIFTGIRHFRH